MNLRRPADRERLGDHPPEDYISAAARRGMAIPTVVQPSSPPGDWLYIWDPANPDTACCFRCEGRVARYHSTVRLMPLLWEGDQN